MKIEHWRSHERYSAQRLQYGNLLGVCRGGEGQPPAKQHCDTCKGNRDLKFNPADPAHVIEARVNYQPDGRIRSDDPVFDRQLNEVLNLNLPLLMRSRKHVFDAIVAWLKEEKKRLGGPVSRDRLERKLERITGGDGDLSPFSRVAAWWIEQKLERK